MEIKHILVNSLRWLDELNAKNIHYISEIRESEIPEFWFFEIHLSLYGWRLFFESQDQANEYNQHIFKRLENERCRPKYCGLAGRI